MAAHFDFGGLSIERYHFVCKPDEATFDLARRASSRNSRGLSRLRPSGGLANVVSLPACARVAHPDLRAVALAEDVWFRMPRKQSDQTLNAVLRG